MMVLLVFNILINSQKCKCASQNENSFFLSPFWGCLLLLFLRPGALPLAICFLPFGHNNLRLVLGFVYALPNLYNLIDTLFYFFHYSFINNPNKFYKSSFIK